MKAITRILVGAALVSPFAWAAGELAAQKPNGPAPAEAAPADGPPAPVETARLASKRYEEMLDKMQAAVEEVAQLYGNPVFLQVFTNDPGRASELKQRLKASESGEEIRKDLASLEKRRADLLSDIALREREIARISSRLARQRAALDSVAAAVEQARKAVEDTSK